MADHDPNRTPEPDAADPSPDLGRYHRQMLLPGFGEVGQRRLRQSTVVLLGCGALGCVAADALTRAGVGRLRIVDRDFIEITNLQRQLLFDERDLADGLPKAEAARRRLSRVNGQVRLEAVVDDVNASSIARLAEGADLLVDGLDNFETRYLVNDYAVKHGLPWVYGGAVGTSGLAFTVLPHTPDRRAPWENLPGGSRATPCLRCLFEQAPPPGESATCDTAGVLGPAVGLVASFQAVEALKILSGNFDRACPTLFNVDLWFNTAMHLDVRAARRDADCPCCRQRRFDYLDGRAGSDAAALCGRDAVQLRHRQSRGLLDLAEAGRRLQAHGPVTRNDFMLRVDLEENGRPYQLTLFPDGRAIVKGTDDISLAKGLYARYVGS